MTRRLFLVLALGLCLPAGAAAATPFTAGQGELPSVAVGADGTGHVVWATSEPPAQVGYCRAAPGAAACDRVQLLPYGPAATAQPNGRVTVAAPAPGTVVIVGNCRACPNGENRTYRWTSTDNGTTFAGPVLLDRRLPAAGTGLWLDDAGLYLGVSRDALKASAGTGDPGVTYVAGGTSWADAEAARVPGSARIVAAVDDSGILKYAAFTGPALSAAALNDPGNWLPDRTVDPAGAGEEAPSLSAGPLGVAITSLRRVPGDDRVLLRRFDAAASAFGAPAEVQGADPIDNDIDRPDAFQDPAGRTHLVWRAAHDGQRLRYRVSDPAGAVFAPAANLARQESFAEPEVAAGPDGKGFVTWTPLTGGGEVRVVAIDPQPETVPAPPAAPGTGGVLPAARARLPVTFAGRRNVLRARVAGRFVRVTMKGAVRLPAGARRAGCARPLTLRIHRGKRTLARRKAKLRFARGRCRFAAVAQVRRARVGGARRLRLTVSHPGNSVLPVSVRRFTVRIRR